MNQRFLHPVILWGIGINAVMLVVAVARSGADPAPLWAILAEDRIVEWMQFLCFVVTSGMLAFLAADRWSRYHKVTLEFLGLLGLSAVVALAALEEISWFQRVIGISSPEFFQQNNRQAETNLHNLALGSGSIHKTVMLKLILIMGLAHNLVLPILARSRPRVREWVESLGLYLPPISAGLAYLLLVTLSHLLIEHPRKGELGEMFGAVHYLATVFAAYMAGYAYNKPAVFTNKKVAAQVGVLFTMLMGLLVLVSWMLAATPMTQAA